MDWISENYQPILVRLPASFQVLPMRGELIIVILLFIHSGFSQPFGVLIVCSKLSFSLPIYFVILGCLGFLIGSSCIEIDILIVCFLLGLGVCSGKLVHIAAVPVCITVA